MGIPRPGLREPRGGCRRRQLLAKLGFGASWRARARRAQATGGERSDDETEETPINPLDADYGLSLTGHRLGPLHNRITRWAMEI